MTIEPLERRIALSSSFPDTNGDFAVDLADFTRLAANFNSSLASRYDGDVSGDGRVDLTDFAILTTNFNRKVAHAPLTISAGGTYSGNYDHVQVNTTQSVVIKDSIVASTAGAAIDISGGSNVTISGVVAAGAVIADGDVQIDHSSFVGGGGVVARGTTLSISRSSFDNNRQIVVNNATGGEIFGNRFLSDSVVLSNVAWLTVQDNLVQGVIRIDGSNITARRNTVINGGIAIVGGHDNTLIDNLVVLGSITIANQTNDPTFAGNGGHGNRVYSASGPAFATPDADQSLWYSNYDMGNGDLPPEFTITTADGAKAEWANLSAGVKVGA